MSDLVGNPEERFSHVAAKLYLQAAQDEKVKNLPWLESKTQEQNVQQGAGDCYASCSLRKTCFFAYDNDA